VNDGQGDREGRPYNIRWRVTRATWYCRGDPRGRPGCQIVFLAIIHKFSRLFLILLHSMVKPCILLWTSS